MIDLRISSSSLSSVEVIKLEDSFDHIACIDLKGIKVHLVPSEFQDIVEVVQLRAAFLQNLLSHGDDLH